MDIRNELEQLRDEKYREFVLRCRVSAPIATKITVNPLTNPNAPNKVFLWCVAHRLQNRRYRWAA